MTTKAYSNGYNWGWDAAGRYIFGTRRDRRALVAYLRRTEESYNQFTTGVRQAIHHRFEDRIEAIRGGLVPRTVSPGRLGYLLNHTV